MLLSTFRLELCQPLASVLPVGKRRLRHVAVSWAALGQAAACQYLCICGTEIKAQGRVDNLIRGKRICHAWVSIRQLRCWLSFVALDIEIRPPGDHRLWNRRRRWAERAPVGAHVASAFDRFWRAPQLSPRCAPSGSELRIMVKHAPHENRPAFGLAIRSRHPHVSI